jgi:hypothetical protein
MRSIREHLALQNPRFVCKDAYEVGELELPLSNESGPPAGPRKLDALRDLAGPAFATLAPLYEEFDGLVFHINGETAGLLVAPIDELEELNREWREWFTDVAPADLYEFQRHGFAFATIVASANYFIVHQGRIYYSGHDGGDDALWGENLEGFFLRALSDPARFLWDAGCYTRYSDGETEAQLIPERFVHD